MTIKAKTKTLFAAIAAVALAGAAQAGTVRLDASGGGTQQVYQLTNGNMLGLIGIDARGAQYDATTVSEADLLGSIQQPSKVVSFRKGEGLVSLLGGTEFEEVAFDFAGPANDKIFSAVWVEWTGGDLGLFKWNSDGTATSRSGTLGGTATLDGDPLAPVPLPAALPLMLVGLGGLGVVARRRNRAKS